MKQIKDKLNEILCNLYDMEYEQEAFRYMLERIERSYGDFENKETKLILTMSRVYVEIIGDKMQNIADELDEVLSKDVVIK